MVNALSDFVRQRADANGWRNRDLVRASGLSKQVVSNYLNDTREQISRLPEKETLAGFAKAFNVSVEFLIGKAIESLGLGYSSGDFINSVTTATDRELLAEIQRRLTKRGGELEDRSAPMIQAARRAGPTRAEREAEIAIETAREYAAGHLEQATAEDKNPPGRGGVA